MPQEVDTVRSAFFEHDVVEGPCSCGAWHKGGVYHEATGGLYPAHGSVGYYTQIDQERAKYQAAQGVVDVRTAMQATHEAQVEGLRREVDAAQAEIRTCEAEVAGLQSANARLEKELDEARQRFVDSDAAHMLTEAKLRVAERERDEATEGELARAVERDEALEELSALQAKLRATEAELSRANAALEPLVLRDLPALERRFAAVVANRDELLATLDATRAECTRQTEEIRTLRAEVERRQDPGLLGGW